MKISGRGASYKKALSQNLIKNLFAHKKIETTRTRGKHIVKKLAGNADVSVVMKPVGRRRGDNAPMVEVSVVDPTKK